MFRFYNLKKFGRFILRLIKWFPILWKQEDWDYEYLYDLIEIKLKELRECLQKDDLHVDSDKYATQISICLAYMDRFRNWDNYVDLPEYASWEKHGLNFSEKATKEYRKSIVKKMISFEKDNYNMFWKRFIQWHRNWWC